MKSTHLYLLAGVTACIMTFAGCVHVVREHPDTTSTTVTTQRTAVPSTTVERTTTY